MRRSKPRRTKQHRDRDYLDWLKERMCAVCLFIGPCDPAHGPVAGTRLKGPDKESIPLCRPHHDEQHALTWPVFEVKYGFSREREAAAHYAVYLLSKENL